MREDWLTPLRALTLQMPPDLVGCSCCDASAIAPPSGLPDGWDGLWGQFTGWVFTCPDCLDAIETDWRAGRPSRLGQGLPQ